MGPKWILPTDKCKLLRKGTLSVLFPSAFLMPREVERHTVSEAVVKSPGAFLSHKVKQISQLQHSNSVDGEHAIASEINQINCGAPG